MSSRTPLIAAICDRAFEKIQNDYAELPYHNLSHTELVLQSALQLAEDRGLPESERELLTLAACAHDVIQDRNPLSSDYNADNEQKSGEWLVSQMKQHPEAFGGNDLRRAPIIINATYVKHREDGLHQSAQSGHQLSELLCDADLSALGSPWDIYEKKMKAYYKELHPNGTPEDWKNYLKLQVSILLQHHYYTKEAQERFYHLRDNAERVEKMLEG